MTAQELIDTIVMHYNGAPDDEALSIGHWSSPQWAQPVTHFTPQIAVKLGDLRGMATARALAAADDLAKMRAKA